jgi:hypothetical protein
MVGKDFKMEEVSLNLLNKDMSNTSIKLLKNKLEVHLSNFLKK